MLAKATITFSLDGKEASRKVEPIGDDKKFMKEVAAILGKMFIKHTEEKAKDAPEYNATSF